MKPSEKPIDRLDQFFKNKLDDHTIAPSENAWTKVEAGLSKKNSVVAWRIAAAILITGALITTIYLSKRTESDQPVLAQKKIEKEAPKTTVADQSKTTEQKIELPSAQSKSTKKSSVKSVVQPTVIPSEEFQKKETIAVNQVVKVNEDTNPVIAVEEKLKVEATTKATVASSQQKPIKLEFTLEDLPSVETVATTSEVKNTGLKKVLELAREMKEGEGPLTSLKEKKNELFARTSSREKKEVNKLN
jgi:hypothetical protein